MSPLFTLGAAVLLLLGLPCLLVLALLLFVLRVMVAVVALFGYNVRRAYNAPQATKTTRR